MSWENPPLWISTMVDFTNFLVWLVYFGIIWELLRACLRYIFTGSFRRKKVK